MERLKQFILSDIVPQYYSMGFQEPTLATLEQLIEFATIAKEWLITTQNEYTEAEDKDKLDYLLYKLDKLIISDKDWEAKYDECCDIRKKMYRISAFSWYGSDTGYEAAIRVFYRDAKKHIDGL